MILGADLTSERLTAWATVALAMITLLLACGTGLLAWYTFKLWKATHDLAADAKAADIAQGERTEAALRLTEESNRLSREAMVADQRAWLSLGAALASGLTWDEHGNVHFAVTFDVHNYGKTPALHAWVDAIAVVFGPGVSEPASDHYPELKRVARERWEVVRGLSLPIYPGRGVTVPHRVMVTAGQIDAANARVNATESGSQSHVFAIGVLACVLYNLAVGEADVSHETGLSVEVDRRVNGARTAIERNGQALQPPELALTAEVGGRVPVT
ncbi:MAG: hypothetical protein ACREMU_15065 [Gemmatimonadaceae bacterium]